MELDPDDPRPPYVKVANALRAAILTKKYAPGDQLPTGNELASMFGVARMTAQQAIRVLRDEGLVISRPGSGVYVRARTERPVGLRPHVERAFESGKVSIDFAGLSGETLHGVLQEPLDKVRAGRHAVESIRIRILVPDTSAPMGIPVRVEGLADDPRLRDRLQNIMLRSVGPLFDSIRELADVGLVKEVTTELRIHRFTPMFKLYVINEVAAFFGYYPVWEHEIAVDGEYVLAYDLAGKDAVLFHHSVTDDAESAESQHVAQARNWFDSIWTTVGREFEP
jgi:DNA-binding transcriptional regulator YhcF (GntR family)